MRMTCLVSVGTVKKSMAAMASRWFRKNVSHRWARSGVRGIRRSHRETVGSDISKPSLSSSPWMRGAPHVGFSAAMRKIKARISLLTGFRPPGFACRERHLQYRRNPARCQPITVLGVTRMSGSFQPAQSLRNTTQNSFCRALSRRRGRFACKARSCWRRARFSRMRSSRRTESTDNPADEVPEPRDHGQNLIGTSRNKPFATRSFSKCTRF
jgi:hypothetical protein